MKLKLNVNINNNLAIGTIFLLIVLLSLNKNGINQSFVKNDRLISCNENCSKKNFQAKMMTFNIRCASANDSDNSWNNRKDICLQIIEKHNPDIVGLQEVEYFQLKEFLERFPNYKYVGDGRNGNNNGEMNPILFKEKFYSIRIGTFWLSDTPDKPASRSYGNRLPRICTWSEFKNVESDEIFYFFNTHLDHESHEARIKGIKQIINFIGDKKKVILTGDFNNYKEFSDEINEVIANNFIDSYRFIHPNEINSGTYHSFTGNSNNAKIDYIFIRSFQVENSAIIKDNKNGKYPSDHFPVDAIVK
jgi:endonuclease/exonuclease/phosphatase family metal-dependent hydrolase